jgi:hypothetical protein
MISDELRDSIRNNDHPVLISYFESSAQAQATVADLRSEGLSEQDFALVVLNETAQQAAASLEPLMAPPNRGQSQLSEFNEGVVDRESQIGGGIETSTPDDDVSAIQEMDDSESTSEDLLYPTEDRSLADEDAPVGEIAAANPGFFETSDADFSQIQYAEHSVDKIALPGIGALLGKVASVPRYWAEYFSSTIRALIGWLFA